MDITPYPQDRSLEDRDGVKTTIKFHPKRLSNGFTGWPTILHLKAQRAVSFYLQQLPDD